MEPSFEIFDHTADAGMRVRAATLPGLIEPATRGLYSLIGELAESGDRESSRFDRSGSDPSELFRDYLAELLLLFECRQRMVTSVRADTFDCRELRLQMETRMVNSVRSVYYREVKAITYHELAIREIAGGYEASVIVDI